MIELIRWLGEQFDEDERVAKEAGARSLRWRLARPLDDEEMGDAGLLRPLELKHAERHDPARVLLDIDAKRDLLRFAVGIHDHHEAFTTGVAARLEATLRLFALAYADRPGYREEWRP